VEGNKGEYGAELYTGKDVKEAQEDMLQNDKLGSM
jgi:hypothetical protein